MDLPGCSSTRHLELPKQESSLQKVVKWLKSFGDNETGLAAFRSYYNAKNLPRKDDEEFKIFDTPVRRNNEVPNNKSREEIVENQETHSALNLKSNSSKNFLKDWTIIRGSSNNITIQGCLINWHGGVKTVKENFFTGIVLSRIKSDSIRTKEGAFVLLGKLNDPKNEIPVQVKSYFSGSFPKNWKEIVGKHWTANGVHNENRVRKGRNVDIDLLSLMSNDSSASNSLSISVHNESDSECVNSKQSKRKRESDVSLDESSSIKKKQNNRTKTKQSKRKCESDVSLDESSSIKKKQLKNHVENVQNVKIDDNSKSGNENHEHARRGSKRTKLQNCNLQEKPLQNEAKQVKVETRKNRKLVNHNIKNKNKTVLVLKNWTLIKESSHVVLKGYIFNLTEEELSDELLTAGRVISSKNFVEVTTDTGIYFISGILQDPDNIIPEKIKEKFIGGFPPNWQDVIESDWIVKESNGNKSANYSEISVSPDLPKGKKRTINTKPKQCDKKPARSKLPTRVRKPAKSVEKENLKVGKQDESSETQTKPVEGVKKNNTRSKRNKEVDSQSPINGSKKGRKGKVKKANANEKNQVDNKKPTQRKISKPAKGKNSKKGKGKNANSNCFEFELLHNSELSANKTNDFFRTFDINCLEEGIQSASFKEISLGSTLQSAKKNLGAPEPSETPHLKHVGEFFSHSITSNHSTHSANSSRDDGLAKRTGIVKRIQKINKGKKKNDHTEQNKVVKKKRCGNAEVNKVFKEITEKKNVLTHTPMMVKKIFRKRLPIDDDDEEMPLDSSGDDDFDDDFF